MTPGGARMQAYFFLSCFSEEDMAWIVENGYQKLVAKDKTLITEGVASEHLMILLEGTFQVRTQELGVIATLHPGEVVGEISIVDDRFPLASVECLDDCSVFFLEREKNHRKNPREPQLWIKFLSVHESFPSSPTKAGAAKKPKDIGIKEYEAEVKGQINPEMLKSLLSVRTAILYSSHESPQRD